MKSGSMSRSSFVSLSVSPTSFFLSLFQEEQRRPPGFSLSSPDMGRLHSILARKVKLTRRRKGREPKKKGKRNGAEKEGLREEEKLDATNHKERKTGTQETERKLTVLWRKTEEKKISSFSSAYLASKIFFMAVVAPPALSPPAPFERML